VVVALVDLEAFVVVVLLDLGIGTAVLNAPWYLCGILGSEKQIKTCWQGRVNRSHGGRHESWPFVLKCSAFKDSKLVDQCL